MKTKEELRRENFGRLLAEECGGSQAEMARRLGKDKNQVNGWLGRGTPRNIGSASARAIEEIFTRESGWLDQDHSSEMSRPSHAMKLDPEILSDAQRLLHEFIGIMGLAPEAAHDPYLLADAYEIASVEAGQATSGDLLGGTKRLAARIRERKGGVRNDDRGSDQATGSADGDAGEEGVRRDAKAKSGRRR